MDSCRQQDSPETPIFPRAVMAEVPRDQSYALDVSLLLNEVNHRFRNLLAVIATLVGQTQSETLEDYQAKLTARISGLRSFYEVVDFWDRQTASFAQLLKQTIVPYCTNGGHVVASGPPVELEPRLALALHLVLHELTTNASKWGALTSPSGCVTVDWEIQQTEGAAPKLAIIWTEHGGPEVKPPARRGFGSRLIARALGGYGQAHLNFRPAGIVCDMLIHHGWDGAHGASCHPIDTSRTDGNAGLPVPQPASKDNDEWQDWPPDESDAEGVDMLHR